MAVEFKVNGETRKLDVEDDMPLLWALRDSLNMTGTKYGCGQALCGACTVLLDGEAVRTCVLPVSAVAGRSITTIEGLSSDNTHPVQQAWLEQDVPQCGYCQSGMVLAATSLLKRTPKPTDADIDAAMSNICRCGTYGRVRTAVHRAAELMAKSK